MTLNPNADTPETKLTEEQRLRAEAGAFRALVAHLQERTDVQNIDLMNLGGFCRNCLSRWYAEEAETMGVALDKMEAREIVHGMPFGEWKRLYQREASADQQREFEAAAAAHAPRGASDAGGANDAGGASDAGGAPTDGAKG